MYQFTSDVHSPTTSCSPDLLISEGDVYELPVNVDCSKASGSDKISGKILKHTAAAITPLVTIFSICMSLECGVFSFMLEDCSCFASSQKGRPPFTI